MALKVHQEFHYSFSFLGGVQIFQNIKEKKDHEKAIVVIIKEKINIL